MTHARAREQRGFVRRQEAKNTWRKEQKINGENSILYVKTAGNDGLHA